MANQIFTPGGPTLLSHPLVVYAILPFLLVFAVVFAVLQKSKILGNDKRQVDAIVAMVIGLIVISFANALDIITQIITFFAVSIVVLLVLMLLIGITVKEGDFDKAFPKAFRYIITIAVFIGVVIAMLWITGSWDWIYNQIFTEGASSPFVTNTIFILIAAGAIWAVVWTSKGDKGDKKGGD